MQLQQPSTSTTATEAFVVARAYKEAFELKLPPSGRQSIICYNMHRPGTSQGLAGAAV